MGAQAIRIRFPLVEGQILNCSKPRLLIWADRRRRPTTLGLGKGKATGNPSGLTTPTPPYVKTYGRLIFGPRASISLPFAPSLARRQSRCLATLPSLPLPPLPQPRAAVVRLSPSNPLDLAFLPLPSFHPISRSSESPGAKCGKCEFPLRLSVPGRPPPPPPPGLQASRAAAQTQTGEGRGEPQSPSRGRGGGSCRSCRRRSVRTGSWSKEPSAL